MTSNDEGPLTLDEAVAELEPDDPDSFIQYPPGRIRAILERLVAGVAEECCQWHGDPAKVICPACEHDANEDVGSP